MSEAALDAAMKALADANRRRILRIVRDDTMSVNDVAAAAALSQQTTSHHLRILKDAGLVHSTQAGTRHLYSVRDNGFALVESYLQEFWPTHLRALKAAAEATHRDSGDG